MIQDPGYEQPEQRISALQKELAACMHSQVALKEREHYLQSLIHNIQEGILIIDREYRITDANKAFMDRAGGENEQIIGRYCYEILHGYNQPCDKFGEHCLLKQVFQTEQSGTCLHQHAHSDGSIVFADLLLSPFKDKHGNVTHVIEAIRDVTELLKTEDALQKAHDELERRVEERTNELKIKTKNLEEVNIALKVLLKRRDEDKIELEEKVLLNVKDLVVSYLDKLKKSGLDEKQLIYIGIMESNLNDIVSPFLRGLSTKYLKLTPMEIQVANLIKQGKSSKEIAELVNLSSRTIEFHRDNIRKKMGIKNKKVNLRTYLLSMQ